MRSIALAVLLCSPLAAQYVFNPFTGKFDKASTPGPQGPQGDPGVVQEVVGTSNQICVDNTDPANPVLSICANPQLGNINGTSMTITAGGAGTPVVGRTHASTVAADPFFGVQNSSNTWLGGFLGSGKVNVPALTSGAAVWDSSGTLQKASGTASDCVKVDGSSGACGTGGGASAAGDVTFTPAGGLSATDVQAALEELDSEKEASLGNPLSDGLCLVSTAAGVRSWAACGTGAASVYAASKTSATTWDVTGATHTLATADLHVMLYSSSGGVRTQVLAQSVVIDEDDYDVHITFASAQAGRIVIIAGGGTGGEGGGLSDAYSSITDGSTTASASGGDTFKLRSASNLLTVAVQSNDVTHGDNALLTVNQANFALSSIGGAVTDSQVPNNITIDLAAAATALAANGSNCSAGSAPIGVDASGAAEGCFAVQASDADLTALAAISGSQGMIAFYGAAGWTSLSPGTSGHFLQTQGAGANPQWAAASVVAPLALTGSTDAVQLDVKGNATQTNPVFRVKKSDDTVLFQVNNDGSVEWGTGGSVMTLNEVSAPGAGASANQHNVYIDSADSKLKSHENGGSVAVYASEAYVTSALSGYAAPSEAYDATGWNGDTAPPQKDAVRDQIETMLTSITAKAPLADPVFTGSMAIPQGASPTTDAAGECAMDTTTGQLQCHDGTAERAWPHIMSSSFTIAAVATTDDLNLMKAPYGMTIVGIDAIIQGGTNVVGQLQECNSSGASCADLDSDITVDTDGAADDGSLTDSAIASGGWLRWKTTSVSGTVDFLTVTVRYRVVAD